MAVPTITDVGSGTETAIRTFVATGATVTATTANNDWLVVVVAAANGGGSGPGSQIDTVTDSVGNTYTRRVNVEYTPGGVSQDGATLAFFTAPVTVNITSGTVTCNFIVNCADSAIQVYRVRPASGTVSFVAADTTGSGSNTTNHAASTVSVANGNTIFGAASIETNDAVTGDSDTTNGSWSSVLTPAAIGAADTDSQTCVSQYKTVTATGNQSWACSTTSARDSVRAYLVIKAQTAALTIDAALGQYALSGTSPVTPRLGHSLVAGGSSYALTGTDVTFINTGTNKTIAAGIGAYNMAGVDATLVLGHKLDVTTAGSYALTGTTATTFRNLPMVAGAGSYAFTGTDAVLTKASLTNKILTGDVGVYALIGTDATFTIVAAKSVVADVGSYTMSGIDAATTHQWKATVTDVGSYALTGTDVALATTANKVILALPGSYALTGTDAALTVGVAPPSVSPLHIGEWPIDKRRRRRREDAAAAEQRARKRFRDAIGRLLEGLPPEFDEPADLDEALDSAVQASNLLYALSAPIREINAVNELIDHIRQLRIAQPIAQLHLAQAYNQAHRHLMAKAQEDAIMALLLGE